MSTGQLQDDSQPHAEEAAHVAALLAGRYRLGDLLGRGGMGAVYRAEDELLDRPVALKLLRATTGADESADEVRLLARLHHPNLVGLLDAGEYDGLPFVVMEFVEGRTLAEAVDKRALAPQQVAVLGSQLASALAYVHGAGVMHRDVKPGNVLLDPDGRARLTDFGIARLVDATRVTPTGFTLGTAAYLAPEQVTGDAVGPTADLYAFGLVLLECLTGHPEYRGSAIEAAVARLHRAPAVPTDLGRDWTSLLRALTATDPAARPTATEAEQRLRRLAVKHDVEALPAPRTEASARFGPRRRLLIGGMAGVALAAGAGTAIATMPARSTDPRLPAAAVGAPLRTTTPTTGAPTPNRSRGSSPVSAPSSKARPAAAAVSTVASRTSSGRGASTISSGTVASTSASSPASTASPRTSSSRAAAAMTSSGSAAGYARPYGGSGSSNASAGASSPGPSKRTSSTPSPAATSSESPSSPNRASTGSSGGYGPRSESDESQWSSDSASADGGSYEH